MQPIYFFLKKIVPWLFAVGIFYYLFKKYPPENLLKSVPYMNLPLFLGYSVLYFIFMWLMDCWGLARILTRLDLPTRAREILTLRLASYPIMIFNYGAAQGAMAYFFKREKNVPFLKSTSLVSFTMLIDLYWMITLAFIGSRLSDVIIAGTHLKKEILVLWLIATFGLFLLVIVDRIPSLGRILNWLRNHHLFNAYRGTSISDYLYAMAVRLPMHLAINSAFYFLAIIFGAHIPFLTVLAYAPIVILASTIPITPGSLGVFQIISVALFQDKISGPLLTEGTVSAAELIVMMTLSFQIMNYLLKGISGSFFIKGVLFRKSLVEGA